MTFYLIEEKATSFVSPGSMIRDSDREGRGGDRG